MQAMVWQAREAHKKVCEHSGLSGHFRAERDGLIRKLYATGEFSYRELAREIGCSTELVAKVCQGRQ